MASFRATDPHAVITPGRALHKLGLRIRCHGCLDNLFEIIAEEDPRHVRASGTAITTGGNGHEG